MNACQLSPFLKTPIYADVLLFLNTLALLIILPWTMILQSSMNLLISKSRVEILESKSSVSMSSFLWNLDMICLVLEDEWLTHICAVSVYVGNFSLSQNTSSSSSMKGWFAVNQISCKHFEVYIFLVFHNFPKFLYYSTEKRRNYALFWINFKKFQKY